jgi:hypothetical protein
MDKGGKWSVLNSRIVPLYLIGNETADKPFLIFNLIGFEHFCSDLKSSFNFFGFMITI